MGQIREKVHNQEKASPTQTFTQILFSLQLEWITGTGIGSMGAPGVGAPS